MGLANPHPHPNLTSRAASRGRKGRDMMKRPRLKPRIRMRSNGPKYHTNTSAFADTDTYGAKRWTYGAMTGRWGRMTGKCGQHRAA